MVQEGAFFPHSQAQERRSQKDKDRKEAQESHSLDELHHQLALTTAHMPRNGHQQNDPIGRKLVKLLRHRIDENGLSPVLRPDGYVPLAAVLRLQQFAGVTVEEVKEVVRSNDKQRMALMEEDGQVFIRANQGHTVAGIKDDALLVPLDAAAAATLGDGRGLAVHGTYHAAWGAIVASGGLKRMTRHHIHLASGLPGDSGVISGMRKSCEVLIWVDVAAAVAAGIPFYTSQNNVILTPGNSDGVLPIAHFARVVERATDRVWRDGDWKQPSGCSSEHGEDVRPVKRAKSD